MLPQSGKVNDTTCNGEPIKVNRMILVYYITSTVNFLLIHYTSMVLIIMKLLSTNA